MKLNFINKLNKSKSSDKSVATLDFVIAGAEKAGTSYFSSALRKSAEVIMPEHEVRHFRDPFFPDRERLDDLLASKGERKAGIKHPSYLGRPEVPQRIFDHNPDMKLLFILRDPVERAISSYLHYIRHGQVPLAHPNVGLLRAIENSSEIPKYRDIREFGLYYKYLSMYAELFPAEQLLVLEYEDFLDGIVDFKIVTDFLGISEIAEPPESRINQGSYDWSKCVADFSRALAFTEFDETMNIVGMRDHPYLPSLDEHYKEFRSKLSGTAIEISPEVRDALAKFYAPDIEKLVSSGLLSPKNW